MNPARKFQKEKTTTTIYKSDKKKNIEANSKFKGRRKRGLPEAHERKMMNAKTQTKFTTELDK